jgi:peptidyl-prolyl cis-trans isomerase D
MITFFRRIFASKIGLAITIGFIGLIAIAFASADVSGTGTFGGVSGGDSVAVVGDQKIPNADFARTASSALDQIRQNNPTATMQAFIEQDGLDNVLDQLIDRFAIAGYAEKFGLRAGDNLVNNEIMQIPAFFGPDGSFSQSAYEGALAQQGLSDAIVRQDFARGLLAEQIEQAATRGAALPSKFALRYAELLGERRKGSIAFLPSAAFAPKDDPTDEQIKTFYDENRARYIRPERRTIRFATFGMENIDVRTAPTDAEIAKRYNDKRDEYSASEERTFTRLIVPTKEAADSIKSRVDGGASLASVAEEAGFSTSEIGPVTKEAYTSENSKAVADAAFAAGRGALAQPVQGALGWHVVKVDKVDAKSARSLAQATPEIREQLTSEMRIAALADLSARIEEQVDEGTPLSKVAEDLDIKITTTPALTADGRIYESPQQTAPEQLGETIATAFQMDEGEPQLAEVTRGEMYIVFEVGEITPSATAPLDEIKDDVKSAWKRDSGAKLAKEAVDRVLKRVAEDGTLAAAVRKEETNLPPAESVNLTRDQIVNQQRQVPPPLALLFSMATGTTKPLEAANDMGFFIVSLNDIETRSMDDNESLLEATTNQLQTALTAEYREQLTRAIREELTVERNESAIEAVRKQLVGES